MQQGRVEEIMKQRLFELSGIAVEYNTCLIDLTIGPTQLDRADAYPCTTILQRQDGRPERIHARYVVGADGGKSQTRQALGFDMQGSTGSSIWGVMDFAGGSDFPEYVLDVEVPIKLGFKGDGCANAPVISFGTTSIIRSDVDGAVDFVRREEGLVRMYVELNKGSEGEHITRETITPELIIKKCQYMLRPYSVGQVPPSINWFEIVRTLTDLPLMWMHSFRSATAFGKPKFHRS